MSVSAKNVFEMKTDNNISIRKTLSIAKNFRKFGVKFEANMKEKLSSFNKQLKNFFEIKNLGEIGGHDSVKDIPIVHCSNVQGLIDKMLATRDTQKEDVLIKFGIDGGGGFFKITLSIVSLEQQSKSVRFKDGGVRRFVFQLL